MLSISGDLPDAEDTCEHASLTGRTSDEMLCYQLGLGVPHSLGAFEALQKCFRDSLPRAVYHGTHRRPKVERSRCWLLSGQTQEHQMPRTGDTVWFELLRVLLKLTDQVQWMPEVIFWARVAYNVSSRPKFGFEKSAG